MTGKKSSYFHGGIRFQSSFTIRWELEDKNFLKIGIVCLDDSLKYRIMAIKTKWKLHTFLQEHDFQKASRDGLGNRFWMNTWLLSVQLKCPDPGVPGDASHDQKPDRVDSLRHQIPAPCFPPPPTGFTLIGTLVRCTEKLLTIFSFKSLGSPHPNAKAWPLYTSFNLCHSMEKSGK